MSTSIDLFDAINTQRAIRRLKPDPVPDEMIDKLLSSAVKAPTGGGKQNWSFIVIKDSDMKRKIGDLYLKERGTAGPQGFPTGNDMTPQQRRIYEGAQYLEDHIYEVPVFIIACIKLSSPVTDVTAGASIYPAVQNILLAARGLGLGSVLTTRQKRFEKNVKDLLGIPDDVETAALLPIGFPADGVEYGPTTRKPLSEVAFQDTWGKSWTN